jgi:glutaredoxin
MCNVYRLNKCKYSADMYNYLFEIDLKFFANLYQLELINRLKGKAVLIVG